ncbi:Peptidase S8 and S53, subtilisin, kexin, sedolisin domain protein, partial [mine drainage metagenome]
DVELWPLAKPGERLTMLARFDAFLAEREIEKLDSLDKTSLLMCRVRTSSAGLNDLLSHRDVRLVDLPPRYGLETELLTIDVNQLSQIDPPPDGVALIGILDSGIVGAHPMLGVAVGEAVGFVPPDREPSDASGHGTRVAGLALYGDIRTCV